MVPLQLFSMVGMAVSALSALLVIYPVRAPPDRRVRKPKGVFTLFGVVFFFIGLALFGIGLLGEYVGRIYAQVRERPRYIVEAVLEEGGAGGDSGGPYDGGCRPWIAVRGRDGSDPRGGVRLQRGRRSLRARAVGAGASRSRCCSRTPTIRAKAAGSAACSELARDARPAGRDARGSEHPASGSPRAGARARISCFRSTTATCSSAAWLALPQRGALNMHGSLLPKYRGRAPVHWAIIHGETATGASLHYMLEKPDAGALVDQQPVPILENDTALEVSLKVAERRSRCSRAACRG